MAITDTTNFNLRGIPLGVMNKLKQEAKKQQISINTALLNLIQESVGHSFQIKRHSHHELDSLAGTWTTDDANAFVEANKFFEEIDKDLQLL